MSTQMPFDSKTFLNSLTTRPGIYQMLDDKAQVLYIGKARNLKNRVSSYFRAQPKDQKTQALMLQVRDISITITQTENEALLLESDLIKKFKPRYNILLKDDKSYPYLFLSTHARFPRLSFHRGTPREKGEYFGPFPNAGAVHQSLDLLQKLFKIRQCDDNFFKNRTRPCLQYQIKRCTAPCVGYIDEEKYGENILHTLLFLKGKNDEVIKLLTNKMEIAAEQLFFEEAARYRDQIIQLRKIQQNQYIVGKKGDIDVLAIAQKDACACIDILYIRNGRLMGNKSFFPKIPRDVNETDILTEFLPQYYLNKNRHYSHPKKILINHTLPDQDWIENALSENIGYKISLSHPKKGQPLIWLNLASVNARHTLASHLSSRMNYEKRLSALQTAFKLPELPERLECFDISHTMGEATVASCVVFGKEGPIRSDYRRFNITNITPGDDYAAMNQVLTRRYARLKEKGAALPDILVIDGGKGQLGQARKVLKELQVDPITLLGVAKGQGRKPGLEKLFLSDDTTPIKLPEDSPVLHLIQQIRDEAHRFAIMGHRQQRAKARITSQLEDIPSIGPKRRKQLLQHFGGLQGVKNASIEDLAKVEGMQSELAKRLYDALHGEE
ncbi:MAG: Excinuclease subunit [Gammaproteobacteria bacterium]|jgi:excinuclease ABC subunit C|nr:Excinuclease subunit [Gammaproteobacteria bacterium]